MTYEEMENYEQIENYQQIQKYEKLLDRLEDRLRELSGLNEKIGRLAYYINTEKEKGNAVDELLEKQLVHMVNYRSILEERIEKEIY